VVGLAVLVVAAAAVLIVDVVNRPAPVRTADQTVTVPAAPGSAAEIHLDAKLYLPAKTPASSVLVSPGFGGTKASVDTDATELARRGFVALAYTPRGFGRSGGQIGLNSPDLEVADARALVSWLGRRAEVRKDGADDPHVGVTGGSYGGALALMLAGSDRRVDTVAAAITYHDLSTSLLPNAATGKIDTSSPAPSTPGTDGVFKRAWAGRLFSAGFGAGGPTAGDCGRFTPQVCRAYTQVATTGKADTATRNLLRRNSPLSFDSHIKVPTLLLQGERDTLFGLDQAEANARQIAAAGAPVKTIWYAGGHDGGLPGPPSRGQIGDFLAYHLDGKGSDPGTTFSYAVQGSVRGDGEAAVTTVAAGRYPGIGTKPVRRNKITLRGKTRTAANPPGGAPAAISGMPGIGSGLGGAASRLSVDVPGEFAAFTSAPLPEQTLVAGSPTVDLDVSGVAGAHEATLFAKLYDVDSNGTRTLPGSEVAPLRITGLPADGSAKRVSVALPGIVQPVQAGHRLSLVVSTTDSSFAPENQPYSVRIGLTGDHAVAVPVVPGTTRTGTFPLGSVIGIGVVLALAALGVLAAALLRRRGRHDAAAGSTPISLRGLSKTYGGDLTVVDSLSFDVEAGQVVGLLGPNGAGKTTALRMMMGLVNPSAGEVRVFGQVIRPGAPVLARIGAFVERSGFLPHLSGRTNLELYWRATGRPTAEARMDEALAIADLGDALRRKVGTYSQGMRQRLAIAQAMLGLPELLILDEPTNGLDPPQIHHMRSVLRDYAATGRTVLVSSHLLAEVEQTCSHVVVMHKGKLVAAGAVAEVVAGGGEATFEVDAPVRAASVLRGLPGVSGVHTVAEDDPDSEWTGDGEVHAVLDGTPRAEAVRALVDGGVGVHRAGPRRRLEDAFLQLVGDQSTGKESQS
jgi:ABC-2 type transport system ATP-binding protein